MPNTQEYRFTKSLNGPGPGADIIIPLADKNIVYFYLSWIGPISRLPDNMGNGAIIGNFLSVHGRESLRPILVPHNCRRLFAHLFYKFLNIVHIGRGTFTKNSE